MVRRLTIRGIARESGVSPTTVSHVFNGRVRQHRIAESTRKRVLAVASRYADDPRIQRYLHRANRTRTLGVCVPDIANPGFATFLSKLEPLARRHDIQLLIASSGSEPDQEREVIHHLVTREADGIIACSSLPDDHFYQDINQHTPVLLYDRHLGSSVLPAVVSESKQSIEALIKGKAEFANDFFFLAAEPHLSVIHDRYQGFMQGLGVNGVDADQRAIFTSHYQEGIGYSLCEQLCDRLQRLPQAVFTASANILEGVVRYLIAHRVPNKAVYLCCYDYSPFIDYCGYDIDVIAQNYDQAAEVCFATMSSLIDHRPIAQRLGQIPTSLYSHQAF